MISEVWMEGRTPAWGMSSMELRKLSSPIRCCIFDDHLLLSANCVNIAVLQESSPSEDQQTLVDGVPLSQAFRFIFLHMLIVK